MAKGDNIRDTRTPHWVADARFSMRTPLLPMRASSGAGLASAEHHAALLEQGVVREALFIASAGLSQKLSHAPSDLAIGSTVRRYLKRMSTRCTPFGLFAGVSVGSIGGSGAAGGQTRLRVATAAKSVRKTRLDCDYLFELCESLRQSPDLRRNFTYKTNSSICDAAGRLRYVEGRSRGRLRRYDLVSVEPDEILESVLRRAHRGITYGELVDFVQLEAEVDREESDGFIAELVDAQLLVAVLSPTITGQDPLDQLVADLQMNADATPVVRVLEGVRDELTALDLAAVGSQRPHDAPYARIERALSTLPTPVDPQRLFQVDVVRPSQELELSHDLVRAVARAVNTVARISRRREGPLDEFAEQFSGRYGEREVPLGEALDAESGVGFGESRSHGRPGAPLLEGLSFPGAAPVVMAPCGPRHTHLLRILNRASSAQGFEVELDERDLTALEGDQPCRLPEAIGALVTLAATSTDALEHGDYSILFHGAEGPCGARFLGRFCHVDPEVEAAVRAHITRQEKARPDAVFAEVVHLPNGRTGNIVSRPVLRDYEIVYLGRSGAPLERQLTIDDLTVQVVHGRVILRSRRLGKEVIPRLTTAHTTHVGLAIYQFLGALSRQGMDPVIWSWDALDDAAFLPRVRWKNVVLSRATWNLDVDTLARIRTGEDIERIRETLGMPTIVVLADGDNELPFDLRLEQERTDLAESLRKRDHAKLLELYPAPEQLVATGEDGEYNHQLLLTYHRDHSPRPAATTTPPSRPQRPTARRQYSPGSQWLYAKVFTGTSTADRVLREAVVPLMRAPQTRDNPMFFLRYGDPDWHLRLRFRGAPGQLMGEVAPALFSALAPLQQDGSIWKFELATYEPEVERYGGPDGIEVSERMFCSDSAACLDVLGGEMGEPHRATQRWMLAAVGVDAWFDAFDLSLEQRLELMTLARDGMGREFNVDTAFRKQLGSRFRVHRAGLAEILGHNAAGDDDLCAASQRLRSMADALRPEAQELTRRARALQLQAPLSSILLSFVHMHVNRMIRTMHRAQELVLYDLLRRHYRANKARSQ